MNQPYSTLLHLYDLFYQSLKRTTHMAVIESHQQKLIYTMPFDLNRMNAYVCSQPYQQVDLNQLMDRFSQYCRHFQPIALEIIGNMNGVVPLELWSSDDTDYYRGGYLPVSDHAVTLDEPYVTSIASSQEELFAWATPQILTHSMNEEEAKNYLAVLNDWFLHCPHFYFCMTRLEGQVAASSLIVMDECNKQAYVGYLATDPAFRGKGLAKANQAGRINFCRDKGCIAVYGWFNEGSWPIAQKHGFQQIPDAHLYYCHPKIKEHL
jgi:GNAT superfamily N-acetyltransferase